MILRRRYRWGGQLWEGQLGSWVPAVECGQHPPQRWWRAPRRHWNEPWRPRGPGGQRQRAIQLPEASRWHHQCNFPYIFSNKFQLWTDLLYIYKHLFCLKISATSSWVGSCPWRYCAGRQLGEDRRRKQERRPRQVQDAQRDQVRIRQEENRYFRKHVIQCM